MPIVNVKSPEIAKLDEQERRHRERTDYLLSLDRRVPRIVERTDHLFSFDRWVLCGWGLLGIIGVLVGGVMLCILGLRLAFYLALGV